MAMMGPGRLSQAPMQAKPNLTLDRVGATAYAAHGLRLLTNAWAGNAVVELRENGGDTTADFFADGALVNSSGDTVGKWLADNSATIAFARTWYDQTGNSRHWTQTTNANQPEMDTVGFAEEHPGLVFRGGSSYYMTGTWTTPFEGADAASTVFLAGEVYNTSGGAARFMEAFDNAANFPYFIIHSIDATPNFVMLIQDNSNNSSAFTGVGSADTDPHALVFRKNGTTADYWVDKSQTGDGVGHDVGTLTNLDGLIIGGSNRGGSLGNFLTGSIAEIIVYDSALTDAEVATIRDD